MRTARAPMPADDPDPATTSTNESPNDSARVARHRESQDPVAAMPFASPSTHHVRLVEPGQEPTPPRASTSTAGGSGGRHARSRGGSPVGPQPSARSDVRPGALPEGTRASEAGFSPTSSQGQSTSAGVDPGTPDQEAGPKSAAPEVAQTSAGRGTCAWPKRVAGTLCQLLLDQVRWIPPVVTSWAKMKPVLRSSVMAWIVLVLGMLVNPIERRLGNASFLVLIVIQPSELPLVAVIEREIFTMLLILVAWAWAAIAIKIADSVRTDRPPPEQWTPQAIFSGEFLQARPAVVCGVFLGFGAAWLLFLKVRFGPSPFLFASILACICLNISLAYAPLEPYANYMLPSQVFYPLALKAGINVVVSSVLFPKSTNSAFVDSLLAVLRPLSAAATQQADMLSTKSPLDEDFDFKAVHNLVAKAEGGLMPLAGAARLLRREVSFGLAGGEDLQRLEALTRNLLNPMDGCAYYFNLLQADIKGTRFPINPAASRFATPPRSALTTPAPSRPRTPEHQSGTSTNAIGVTASEAGHRHVAQHDEHRGHLNAALHRLHLRPHHTSDSASSFRTSFHRESRAPSPSPGVGIWESLKFAALETRLHRRENDRYSELCARLLGKTTSPLLRAEADAIDHLVAWFDRLNRDRTKLFRQRLFGRPPSLPNETEKGRVDAADVMASLRNELDHFRTLKLELLEPFAASLDPDAEPERRIPHRYLYQAYLHQYWVRCFAERLLAILEVVHSLEVQEVKGRLWFPTLPSLLRLDMWRSMLRHDHRGQDENDDGAHEMAPGGMSETTNILERGSAQDEGDDKGRVGVSILGATRARDPEAMDPQGPLQKLGTLVSHWLHSLTTPTPAFVVKAGIVTVLVTLPQYFKSTAEFMYTSKGIWVATMTQLTFSRHRGEVGLGVLTRLQATLQGCVLGMIVWYIVAGSSGDPNRYALAVVCAIAFPFVFLIRIHGPGLIIVNIITGVSFALVLGYSIKDRYSPTYGSVGVGFHVAWRRFLEVAIGTSAAYVMSLLPPASTLRTYQRRSHAAVITELGQLYCRVVTFATEPHNHVDGGAGAHMGATTASSAAQLRKALQATRSKLRALGLLRSSVRYELSLRGRWPTERYEALSAVQMELSKLLSSLVAVLEQLGPDYSRALLQRTRFLDPSFLADAVSALSMCATALRTSEPLPQITPVLLERFLRDPGQGGFAFGADSDSDDELNATQAESRPAHRRRGFRHGDDDNVGEGAGQGDAHYRGDGADEDVPPHDAAARRDSEDARARPSRQEGVAVGRLPRTITMATLRSDEYHTFSVGVSVAFGIVLRIDRLVLAVKELVGESFSVPADLHRRYGSFKPMA